MVRALRFTPTPQFRSTLRSTRLTAQLGLWLGIAFGICFLTGLVSHFMQHPLPGLAWPSRSAARPRMSGAPTLPCSPALEN